MKVHRRPVSPLGIPVFQVHVLASVHDVLRVPHDFGHLFHALRGCEKAMNQDVSIPSDRRGEVCVVAHCKAEMLPVVLLKLGVAGAKVRGRRHAARGEDANQPVEEGVIRLVDIVQGSLQRLVGLVFEVLDAIGLQNLHQLIHAVVLRRGMPPKDTHVLPARADLLGNAPVGQKHELLDELVCVPRLITEHICGKLGLRVQLKLELTAF
mmetsp:Transcript_16092/g.30324  ORF Transcript_16092/g.30324 Transcript_16092/m.30324 type:complete len:209 (+) Transcript_16092:408-1034(+)